MTGYACSLTPNPKLSLTWFNTVILTSSEGDPHLTEYKLGFPKSKYHMVVFHLLNCSLQMSQRLFLSPSWAKACSISKESKKKKERDLVHSCTLRREVSVSCNVILQTPPYWVLRAETDPHILATYCSWTVLPQELNSRSLLWVKNTHLFTDIIYNSHNSPFNKFWHPRLRANAPQIHSLEHELGFPWVYYPLEVPYIVIPFTHEDISLKMSWGLKGTF